VRVVLDTNVVMSGLFFGGVPGRILEAWQADRLSLVISPSILEEYRRVGALLARRYPGVDFEPFAALLMLSSELVDAPAHLKSGVSDDPDDDKFLACAAAAGAGVVVSGDPHLLNVSGWAGVEVLRPRAFVERYLVDRSDADS
jgi:putative PIN family toxin of toxin-antitoxin system